MDEPRAWDKLENESANAYFFFQQYLRQEKPRNLSKLARDNNSHFQTMSKYKDLNNWYERAEAYDTHMYSLIEVADIKRQVVPLDNKSLVITEELEDYQLLRQLWLKTANEVMTDDEIANDPAALLGALGMLAKTRQTIDAMARMAVELPSSYTKKINLEAPVEQVEPTKVTLTMKGPQYEREQ